MSNELVELNKENGFLDLSEKDRAFAVEYITNGFRHTDAAVTMGWQKKLGIQKLRDPLINAFIRHLQESDEFGKLITQGFVEQKYLEVLPKLMGEEEIPMVNMKDGEEFTAKKFHSGEVVSVLRDLGKSAGYIAPEIGPKGGAVNVQINLGDLAGDDPIVEIKSDE